MALPNPFQPKAEIDFQAGDSALPGSTIPIKIVLTPREDIKPREVRVVLTGHETYYVKQHQGGKNGGTRIVKRTADFSVVSQTLAQQPVLNRGIPQSWNTSLTVPAGDPPTSRGKYVDVRWSLKSIIDVPMRLDRSAEMPLQVYLPPQEMGSAPLPAVNDCDECLLKMDAPHMAAPGETLIGHLSLELKKELQVRGIRVELIAYEDAGARKTSGAAASQVIAESLSFNPYEARSFDFAVAVPPNSPPSVTTPHSSLRWTLKATLDRRLRGDINVEQEILLYNAPETKT